MIKQITYILILFIAFTGYSQQSLSDLLSAHSTKHIPYLSVQELAMPKTGALIFDAREAEEFSVSHLKNAVFVGYNDFAIDSILQKHKVKNQMIVVYCSLGIRSGNIADKLTKDGYTNVYNLYGGIFEWKNEQFPVYDSEGNETEEIHTFSKSWSKWLHKGTAIYN